uniref:DUF148 domain-containing protein n=1 Tax=Meloidogyne hapla TaxID=6305 RepID=A0A1I8B1U4_MELHA
MSSNIKNLVFGSILLMIICQFNVFGSNTGGGAGRVRGNGGARQGNSNSSRVSSTDTTRANVLQNTINYLQGLNRNIDDLSEMLANLINPNANRNVGHLDQGTRRYLTALTTQNLTPEQRNAFADQLFAIMQQNPQNNITREQLAQNFDQILDQIRATLQQNPGRVRL